MTINVVPFVPAHYAALARAQGHPERIDASALSQIAGPAYTLMKGRKIVLACGGIRVMGIGQAWACFDPKALQDERMALVRASKRILDTMIAAERLFKIYAEASEGVPDNWFETMGFIKQQKIFVRS